MDMDAFFAAVEQLDHPEWRGLPVIVGGDPNGRGVVSTASYEARPYGVRSAMPAATAARLCPDAIWVRPRGTRYRELSLQVRECLWAETPLVEPVSIDEAYLDVTPGRYEPEHPAEAARRIQERVEELGLSCSVGVATSKVVAKIASDADKPGGLTVVSPGEEAAFLAPLPVSSLPGAGAVTCERLAGFGVHTLGRLASLDEDSALEILGSHGMSFVRRARGIDERPVVASPERKSVSHERTFSEDLTAREEVHHELASLAERVGRRLRAKGMRGRTVTVKLRYADFTTRTVQRTLPSVTDSERVFGPVAAELLDSVWRPGTGLRLLGVGLSGFGPATEQMDLFSGVEEERRAADDALTRGLDRVRDRFGEDAVSYGPPRRKREEESRDEGG